MDGWSSMLQFGHGALRSAASWSSSACASGVLSVSAWCLVRRLRREQVAIAAGSERCVWVLYRRGCAIVRAGWLWIWTAGARRDWFDGHAAIAMGFVTVQVLFFRLRINYRGSNWVNRVMSVCCFVLPFLVPCLLAAVSHGEIWPAFCLIREFLEWWVMVSLCVTAAGLFWTVNVCWAHPVISRAMQ